MSTDAYFLKIQSLSQEKLLEEEKRLYNILYKTNETSPVYNQIWSMLDMIRDTIQERLFMERQGKLPDSEIIEIGKIEEVVYTPDYNAEELLLAVVHQYTSKMGSNK